MKSRRVEVNTRHQMTEVDPATRTGRCSWCGPTKAYKSGVYKGEQKWRCSSLAKRYANDRCLDPEVYRASKNARFKRLYGITIEEYEDMVAKQDGRCARCGLRPGPSSPKLAVDHCHKTGAVRLLLCGSCNTYLGRLEAHRDTLEADMHYLDHGYFAQVIADRL